MPSGVPLGCTRGNFGAGVEQGAQLGVGEFRSGVSATELRVQFRKIEQIPLVFLSLETGSVRIDRIKFGIVSVSVPRLRKLVAFLGDIGLSVGLLITRSAVRARPGERNK